ncbi:PAAR domain-containing protein [Thalassomonas viridans]|uniref:PAAR domain-containing protein n=1 Tax=Thalassomonas viridans TaxID=137584 RepID=A0AAE9Z1R5_9GAMM|nr:PAAR domain-containing protein [Thalassomonas viridans]WDE04657.1 PAAR domain-containing protein [Thalassomonas viridans]
MPQVSLNGHVTDVHSLFLPGAGIATVGNFTIGGIAPLRVGDEISTHVLSTDPKVKHEKITIAAGSGSFSIGGKAVARLGDACGCGAKMAQGFATFSAGG